MNEKLSIERTPCAPPPVRCSIVRRETFFEGVELTASLPQSGKQRSRVEAEAKVMARSCNSSR